MLGRNERHDDDSYEKLRQAADSILAKAQAEFEADPDWAVWLKKRPDRRLAQLYMAVLGMRRELARPEPDYARLFLELLQDRVRMGMASFPPDTESVNAAIAFRNWQAASHPRRSKYHAEHQACMARINLLLARKRPPTHAAIRREMHERFPEIPPQTVSLWVARALKQENPKNN